MKTRKKTKQPTKIQPKKKRPKYVYSAEVVEIAIVKCSKKLSWYNGFEGTIYNVNKCTNGDHYRTIDPIFQNCGYGLIRFADCEVLG